MQMSVASSRIEENGCLSMKSRIASSIMVTSGSLSDSEEIEGAAAVGDIW
jgi:hypothetical protein